MSKRVRSAGSSNCSVYDAKRPRNDKDDRDDPDCSQDPPTGGSRWPSQSRSNGTPSLNNTRSGSHKRGQEPQQRTYGKDATCGLERQFDRLSQFSGNSDSTLSGIVSTTSLIPDELLAQHHQDLEEIDWEDWEDNLRKNSRIDDSDSELPTSNSPRLQVHPFFDETGYQPMTPRPWNHHLLPV